MPQPLRSQLITDQTPLLYVELPLITRHINSPARHEVDGVRRRHLAGNDQVALVLPVLMVDEDEHAV